ncbi:unknown protein [Microcystis aeruginosa NIES-843]|uniref:Uncharacterized protein n=1 Tax=Microcystis aeruginosa (strain NIES-843 / IAM M-2473) TaxID=449447 RepID=B0JR97_MICAN|nr:unknown protein [Microcystis aeruginosa NIES-843]
MIVTGYLVDDRWCVSNAPYVLLSRFTKVRCTLFNSQEKACIMTAIVRFLSQDYTYG